ncbi:hypothetical protein PAXRUDRAFT_132070, partial [Paxillus rubicundulus Ve08.2h10]
DLEEDCIWAADETGFQPGEGLKQWVVRPAKKKTQHLQHDENQETLTVMVSICADEMGIPPTVIYKGQKFSMQWHNDNPLNVLIAHSSKGWTDGVIGHLWIEDFDKKTAEKANGWARLLLVDSHNSHYTKDFLEYAHKRNIHVLCYPSHATHVYQGLNIVIFSPLKHSWTAKRDEYEALTHQKVTKSNFILVYSKTHRKALTPENICATFHKTGVWPFNPNAITAEMMAPSLETSSSGHLPLPQPSPVQAVMGVICQYHQEQQSALTAPSESPMNDDPFIVPSWSSSRSSPETPTDAPSTQIMVSAQQATVPLHQHWLHS